METDQFEAWIQWRIDRATSLQSHVEKANDRTLAHYYYQRAIYWRVLEAYKHFKATGEPRHISDYSL